MTEDYPHNMFSVSPVRRRRSAEIVDPLGYKIVSVRLRSAEFESFSEQLRALGLTSNLALRIAARRIAGFLEIDAY
ncbi:DNA mobilization endonuclease VirD1/MobC family subunit, partial [Rhizobium johnstonii]